VIDIARKFRDSCRDSKKTCLSLYNTFTDESSNTSPPLGGHNDHKKGDLALVAHHSSCSATVRTPHVTPVRPVFQFLEMLLDLHSLEKRVFSVERFQTSAKKTAFKTAATLLSNTQKYPG